MLMDWERVQLQRDQIIMKFLSKLDFFIIILWSSTKHLCILVPAPLLCLICINFLQGSRKLTFGAISEKFALYLPELHLLKVLFGTKLMSIATVQSKKVPCLMPNYHFFVSDLLDILVGSLDWVILEYKILHHKKICPNFCKFCKLKIIYS